MDKVHIKWPFVAIDFEASGLGAGTYPIEIGIAVKEDPDATIKVWSTLIRPTRIWISHGDWQPIAETIHGLTQGDLERGASPHDALAAAMALVRGGIAWCDGGPHDLHWLNQLQTAAGMNRDFVLGDLHALLPRFDEKAISRMEAWKTRQAIRHRAGADAVQIVEMIEIGLQQDPKQDRNNE